MKTWYEHNAEKVGRNKEISGNKVTNKEGARKRIEKEIQCRTVYTLKTGFFVCSLIYTQYDNRSALVIEFHSLVNSCHTLSLGKKCANLCINLS